MPEFTNLSFTSVYVHRHGNTRDLLVGSAAADLETVLETADVLVGHQLCSDLGVLAQTDPVPAVITAARHAWATRRRPDLADKTSPTRPLAWWTPATTPTPSCRADHGGWSTSARNSASMSPSPSSPSPGGP